MPADLAEKFGLAVRKRRKILKLSQEELAEKADLHRVYMSRIERGKVEVSLYVAYRIAEALKVKICDLIKK